MEYAKILINILVFLLIAPFFDGVVRKITARVQSRKGPSVFQTYFDILKLFIKEDINPGGSKVFAFAPILAMVSILMVIAIVPFGYQGNALSQWIDVITIIYLLTMSGVAIIFGALASGNTFAHIGASREMVTMIMLEPVLAMTFILTIVKVQSLELSAVIAGVGTTGYTFSTVLMLIIYIMALQAFVARQPFDIAEAEIEILEGPFIEYSGPSYGLFKYFMMLKQTFYAYILVAIFAPFLKTSFYGLNVLIQLAGMLLVVLFIALIGSTNPRLRIDQAVKYYALLIFCSLCTVGLSAYGY